MQIIHKGNQSKTDEIKDLREAWKIPAPDVQKDLAEKHVKMVAEFYENLFIRIFGRPFQYLEDGELMQINNYPDLNETRLFIKGVGEVGIIKTEIGNISFTPFKEFTK